MCSHGFKAAARYRDFKHIAAFSVTKLLFQVILAPLERKMEDGLETLLLLEKHTRRVVQEERNMRDDLVRAGLKMTLKMEVYGQLSIERDYTDRSCASHMTLMDGVWFWFSMRRRRHLKMETRTGGSAQSAKPTAGFHTVRHTSAQCFNMRAELRCA